MGKFIDLTFDDELDCAIIRYKAAAIENASDVTAWAKEVDAGFRRRPGKKMDIIVDLGEMVIRPAAMAAYDEARLKLFSAYAKRAYRYGGTGVVRTRILTSAALHTQAANLYATLEEARDAMLRDRREG